MGERRALMSAIIANPDDDTPRLVFADWLDEHGDKHDQARAELIRLQVEAARLPEGDSNRKKLESRAGKLKTNHSKAWLAALTAVDPKFTSSDHREPPFVRGLLKYLLFDTSEFLLKKYQPAIPDALAAVGVEELGFYSATKRFKALAASPAIRWACRVQYPGPDDAALEAFGASPHFAHLSGLAFDEVAATDAGLKQFAKSSGTTRLAAFGLASGGGMSTPRGKYTAAGVLAILDSARFPLLTALDLEQDQPVKFDWKAFFASAGLKQLTTLRVRLGTNMTIAPLVSCLHLTSLRELRINSSLIADADADALLANPALSKLAQFQMYGMNWGRPRLSKPVEKRLRARFGKGVLAYSPEQR
jgi:uncharacterized protein (TIGR02996 family)